ncbi:MAG: DUF397 domain-containing protein [Streptosporangiaceae bacterium]
MNVRTNRLTVAACDDSVRDDSVRDDSVRDDSAARGAWRKSSYSGGGNNCVEVAAGAATVAVRDSKDPEGGELAFGVTAWTAFTTAIKRGGYESL